MRDIALVKRRLMRRRTGQHLLARNPTGNDYGVDFMFGVSRHFTQMTMRSFNVVNRCWL